MIIKWKINQIPTEFPLTAVFNNVVRIDENEEVTESLSTSLDNVVDDAVKKLIAKCKISTERMSILIYVVEGGIEAQAKQVMENLKQVILAGGLNFDDVVKTTIFILDMGDFVAVNKVYEQYFTNTLPARSCVAVASLPKEALVEIELVAYCKNK